jgi:hypothetical protein
MLDLSHIPNSQQDIQIFNANGSAWQTWQKPRKCNYVWIMCVGGAPAGPVGSTVSNSGFGAAPSAAITRVIYSAQMLPDRLYIQVGLGGASGNTAPGNPGTRTFASMQPINTAAQNLVCVSGTAAATGSSVETAATQTSCTFFALGNFISTPGVAGANFADSTPLTSSPFSGGVPTTYFSTPGGTADSGYSILATSISPRISGGTGNTTGNGARGADGIFSLSPFYSLAGAGGGASLTGIGGDGGNGGIGSPGGGGGAGPLGGGRGGKGGDGLVIIISF